jgi:hypothetical protein
MDWGRQMAFVNHFYFYLWDSEWGGTFWKTNAYAPFPIWLWLNGHEWAKRQLEHAGWRCGPSCTKIYGRVLAPGLGALDPRLAEAGAGRSPLAVAWHRFEAALNDFIEENLVAA